MELSDTETKELAIWHRSAEAFYFSSWKQIFSSHCCCNAPPPLLPRWQGRVDCMLWYALSRNLWMCRSIIAILYLIGHFSLPHLAEVSSSPPCPPSLKGYRSHMFTLSMVFLFFFFLGWSLNKSLSASLSFLFRVRIGGPLSLRPHLCLQEKKKKRRSKVSKPIIFTLNCCRSPLQRGSTTTTTRQLCA